MKVVGLTGGMGTGKSTVGRQLAALGAVVIDTDQLARVAVAPGMPALERLVRAFGPGILDPSGSLDRAHLAELAFAGPEQTAVLNSIVHPAVDTLIAEQLGSLAAAGVEIVVLEIPLLFEVGLERIVHTTVVVVADEAVQERRLAAAGFNLEDARRRIAAQMPLEEKAARADHVLDNSGTPTALDEQVRGLWSVLTAN